MTDPTPTDEQRDELTEPLAGVLESHLWEYPDSFCECGYYVAVPSAHKWHVADALAPIIARMVADAGCELQRTGDGTHGPLIRQAKAEALREAAEDAARAGRGALLGRYDVARWLLARADGVQPERAPEIGSVPYSGRA